MSSLLSVAGSGASVLVVGVDVESADLGREEHGPDLGVSRRRK